MLIRNPKSITSYISLNKLVLVFFVGMISMRSPDASAETTTLSCMLLLFATCWLQQFKDKKNVLQVFNYLSSKLPVNEKSSARLLTLSENVVVFAVNSRDSNQSIHAAVKEVLNGVNTARSKQMNQYTTTGFDSLTVAEQVFEEWRKKALAGDGTEKSST